MAGKVREQNRDLRSQPLQIAISNVERDFDKSMKIAAWEQTSRVWKRVRWKTKDDADNWSDV